MDSHFRRLFPYSEKMEKYILIDPGYSGYFPVARFDILLDKNGEIKFCELNSDGTSAMNEVRVMQNILAGSRAAALLRKEEGISFYGFELFNSWINTILEKYREFSGKKRVNPSIGIMDFKSDGVLSEFEVFKKYMENRGLEACIVDPRELKYDGSTLKYKNRVIDLIYRRATTARLFENFSEITPLFKGYRAGDICLCGSFRSQIIHNKAIFHMLAQPENLDFLDSKEKKFLNRHILSTELLKHEHAEDRKIIENREKFILKPCDKFDGKGIRQGKNLNEDEWMGAVKKCSAKNYLLQEFCQPRTIDLFTLPESSDEKPEYRAYNYTLGFYMYDGNLQGLYNRAGRYDIISSEYECVTVPCFVTSPAQTACKDLIEEVKYE